MYYSSVVAWFGAILIGILLITDLETMIETGSLREVYSVPDGTCDLSEFYLKSLLNVDIMIMYVKRAVITSFCSKLPALFTVPFSLLTAEFFGNILIFISIFIAVCGTSYGYFWDCFMKPYDDLKTAPAVRLMLNESMCEHLPKEYIDNALDSLDAISNFYRNFVAVIFLLCISFFLVFTIIYDCYDDWKNYNFFSNDNAPMFPVLNYPWKRSMLLFFDRVRVFCGFERKHTVIVPTSDEDCENAESGKKIILKKDISTDPHANVFDNCENI